MAFHLDPEGVLVSCCTAIAMVPYRCSCVLYLALLVSSSTVRSQPVPFDPEGSTKQRQQREKHASTLSLWGAVAVAANISSWGVGLAGSVASTAYSTVYDLGFGGKCNTFVMGFGMTLAVRCTDSVAAPTVD
jgi:hypothetical protein